MWWPRRGSRGYYIRGNDADMRPGTPPYERAAERFAALVAHDLNNLLTGILGNLELLQNRVTRERMTGLDDYLQGAISAGARAAAFAQRLQLFSAAGAEKAQLVRVDALLRRHKRGAALALGAGDAAIRCDPAQLVQALDELLDNAAAALPPKGGIFISSALVGDDIIITVRDTGPGMSQAILARAGEAFFTTQPNATGRGLGLAIARSNIEAAGGSLHIQSAENAGCTVTLTLPRAHS